MNKPKNKELFQLLDAGYSVELWKGPHGHTYINLKREGFFSNQLIGMPGEGRPTRQGKMTKFLKRIIRENNIE